MLINLKTCAIKTERQGIVLELGERLPARLKAPCAINCQFDVEPFDNYYVMRLMVDSVLTVVCQRCSNEFIYLYKNQTELAICNSDEMAEKLMERYECIVSQNNQVDLVELITDELHLYAPEFHPELKDCDDELGKFMNLK